MRGWYRTVFPKMWMRGSFMRLSGPAVPNARYLWLYLLTGDATIILPGVVPIGRLALAEKLEWEEHLYEIEDERALFDVCVEELEEQGMAKFDWKARLVWCPAAIEHNPPQSPNVTIAWAKALYELTDCDLKVEIASSIREFLGAMTNKAFYAAFESEIEAIGEGNPKAFTEAFKEAFPEVFPKDFGKPVNREQKAENRESSQVVSISDRAPKCPYSTIAELWQELVIPEQQRYREIDSIVFMPDRVKARVQKAWKRAWRRDPANPLNEIQGVFELVAISPFLCGAKSDFIASLDWVVGPRNEAKILSGKYNPPPKKINTQHAGAASTSGEIEEAHDEWLLQVRKDFERGKNKSMALSKKVGLIVYGACTTMCEYITLILKSDDRRDRTEEYERVIKIEEDMLEQIWREMPKKQKEEIEQKTKDASNDSAKVTIRYKLLRELYSLPRPE